MLNVTSICKIVGIKHFKSTGEKGGDVYTVFGKIGGAIFRAEAAGGVYVACRDGKLKKGDIVPLNGEIRKIITKEADLPKDLPKGVTVPFYEMTMRNLLTEDGPILVAADVSLFSDDEKKKWHEVSTKDGSKFMAATVMTTVDRAGADGKEPAVFPELTTNMKINPAAEHNQKGSGYFVTGTYKLREYAAKDGSKGFSPSINVQLLKFGRKPGSSSGSGGSAASSDSSDDDFFNEKPSTTKSAAPEAAGGDDFESFFD